MICFTKPYFPLSVRMCIHPQAWHLNFSQLLIFQGMKSDTLCFLNAYHLAWALGAHHPDMVWWSSSNDMIIIIPSYGPYLQFLTFLTMTPKIFKSISSGHLVYLSSLVANDMLGMWSSKGRLLACVQYSSHVESKDDRLPFRCRIWWRLDLGGIIPEMICTRRYKREETVE